MVYEELHTPTYRAIMKSLFRAFLRALAGLVASLSIGAGLALANPAPVPDVTPVATAPPHEKAATLRHTSAPTDYCELSVVLPPMIRLDHHGTMVVTTSEFTDHVSVLAPAAMAPAHGGSRNAEIV